MPIPGDIFIPYMESTLHFFGIQSRMIYEEIIFALFERLEHLEETGLFFFQGFMASLVGDV
ncbi:hypothetical protein SDC9_167172 [bioreactor metagenome]|uniref:Uncharacterized protein n=1 Tax=bioreactor metagenome TaxID=1076179 RepID=A0A645G1N2_9ZZZZ